MLNPRPSHAPRPATQLALCLLGVTFMGCLYPDSTPATSPTPTQEATDTGGVSPTQSQTATPAGTPTGPSPTATARPQTPTQLAQTPAPTPTNTATQATQTPTPAASITPGSPTPSETAPVGTAPTQSPSPTPEATPQGPTPTAQGPTQEPTPTQASGPPWVVEDGCGHVLRVQAEPFSMTLEDSDGRVRSTLGAGGLRVGAVPELDPDYNYDPWYFYQTVFVGAANGPDGLEWLASTSVLDATAEADGLALTVGLADGSAAELRITRQCPTAFKLELEAPAVPTAYLALDVAAPVGERFYGLGEVFDSVEHRGQIRAMQFEVDATLESGYNEAHVPVPLLISTAGWGLFVADDHPGIFDVASSERNKVRVEYGSPQLTAFWMAAERPAEIIPTYTGLTAAPAMPPVWAFAPIQWRDDIPGQVEVLDDAAQIRAHGIPGSGIWLDRPYSTTISSLDMAADRYPEPEAMVQSLHDKGFRLAAWSVPYMEETDPDYAMVSEAGWLVTGPVLLNGWGEMIDLTNPDAMAWWQSKVRAAQGRGFEGWKLDYGEDIQSGVGSQALHFGFYNQQDGDTMHHRVSDYYHRAYQEPYDGQDTFIISRAGAWGGQRYTSVIWPGDLCNDFFVHGEGELPAHVGGLPAAMIAGMSLSSSGFPFFASDTGGYRHGKVRKEVLLRWAQYSAMLPVMQYCGTSDECNPWNLEPDAEATYDQQTLEVFRSYAQLHMDLFPFFYGLAERARDHGDAPVLPHGLYWPQDGRHPDDQMVVGESLLVAPMVFGGESRSVRLPEGRFVDWFTGAQVQGPVDLEVQAPIQTSPLYLIEGAIVPMLRPGVQTLAETTDAGISSWPAEAGAIWGVLVPGAEQTSRAVPFGGGTLELGIEGDVVVVGRRGAQAGTRWTGVNLRIWAPDTVGVVKDSQVLPRARIDETATCDMCWAQEEGDPWLWLGVSGNSSWQVRVL